MSRSDEANKSGDKNRGMYSPKQLPQKPTCKHVKMKAFKCNELTMADLMKIHQQFYSKKDKLSQDTYILKWCNSGDPKRHRNMTQITKSVAIEYRVPTLHSKHSCILWNFGSKKGSSTGGYEKVSKRKDRVKGKNDEKKKAISEYIESLNSVASHYCRSEVSTRTYLPCDLNIKRLAKMYNDSVEEHLQVKESFFRFYFNTNYNIGFGTPKTDVCSTCIRFKEELKKEKDVGKHNDLIIKQRVHTLKAKAFFQLLKESRQTRETFSIDCQKNLCLPKLPDQSAYFSQQYNLFNFTVVNGSSKYKLGKDRYSIEKDAAFCYPCQQFLPHGSKQTSYTSTGFRNWKNATDSKTGFPKHEKSISHIQAMSMWQEKLQRISTSSSVETMINQKLLEKYRYYVKSIFEVIQFLIINELALRGNYILEEENEQGLFQNLFEYTNSKSNRSINSSGSTKFHCQRY
nr:unnamed protein product [Callosobruchus chinensis]